MPSLYAPPLNRLKLLSQAVAATTTSDSGFALAFVATPAVDRGAAVENLGPASRDGALPFASLAAMSSGGAVEASVPTETGAAVRMVRDAVGEAVMVLSRANAPDPAEWSGAAQLAADAMVPSEAAAATAGDANGLAESAALLSPKTGSGAEWLANNRAAAGTITEARALLARDADSSTEWLGAGSPMLVDALPVFEWLETTSRAVPSLESRPGRNRLLATPGRVRLLRRG